MTDLMFSILKILQNLYEVQKLYNLGKANFLTRISESSIPQLGSR